LSLDARSWRPRRRRSCAAEPVQGRRCRREPYPCPR
jgi:hypothetical protein